MKGDISGAVANAIVVIPMAVGYGMIALAPLGPAYASQGAMMGLYASVFCAFWASVVGRTPVQMTGPKAPLALVMASLVACLMASEHIPSNLGARQEIIIAMTAVSVGFAGLVQIACGVLGIGNIVKYIPHPVVSGFMNGIAMLLIIKQLKPFFGVKSQIMEIFISPCIISLSCLAVGTVTLATFFIWPKTRLKIIPAPFAAFLTGTALYYGLSLVFMDPEAVIGKIPSGIPKPDAVLFLLHWPTHLNFYHFLPTLLLSGFFIGILGAMDSLLSSVVCGNLTGQRPETRRELMGQGVGNLVCSLFNGLPGAGSVPGVMTTHAAGGRTAAAGAISGAAVLVILVFLGPMVGKIPLAVVAGIIIAVAVKMIDAQTIAFLMSPKKLLKSGKEQKIDLAVNLMVALLTVTVNLLVAVGAGLALASALFIARSGRSIIHRKYTLSQFRSRRMRPTTHQEILDKAGQETVILELKGPLFFGASDLLARQDDDRRLYFLVQGLVSVRLKTKDGLRVNRLASFSPGVIFGELSMLDGSLRSAEVVAEKDSQVLELPFHIFKELQQNHPELTAKLTTGIALWLSNRLKILSREIQVLERD